MNLVTHISISLITEAATHICKTVNMYVNDSLQKVCLAAFYTIYDMIYLTAIG